MAMTLITTNTSSGAASSSFTSSIDSTYKLYIFKFYDVNPATDGAEFNFEVSTDGGSNYNLNITAPMFVAYQNEAGDSSNLAYDDTFDTTESTESTIASNVGNGSDESCAGTLWLFNPSSSTYVKHFYSIINTYHSGDYSQEVFSGGYINSTSDVDAIRFKMSAGNMDGVIKMYGVG